jgi:hypothetical protein
MLSNNSNTAPWSDLLNEIEKVLRILAIVMAGIWAYYRYFRGRTFRPRVELTVSGLVVQKDGKEYMVATVGLQNLGLSRVGIDQIGTALFVSTSNADSSPFFDVEWSRPSGFQVFTTHTGIEPNEPIVNKLLYRLPTGQSFVKLHLQVVSGKQKYTADEIIACGAQMVKEPHDDTAL